MKLITNLWCECFNQCLGKSMETYKNVPINYVDMPKTESCVLLSKPPITGKS